MLVDDDKALVGLVEVTIGLLPAGGGTQRLPRLIGVERALALMLEGRRLKPAEALACGAVDQVVPRDRLLAAARAWVRRTSARGAAVGHARASRARRGRLRLGRARAELVARTHGRYPAPLALFDAVRDGVALPIDEGLQIESTYSRDLLPGAVARNLMRTGFVHRQLARRFAGEPGAYVQRLRCAAKTKSLRCSPKAWRRSAGAGGARRRLVGDAVARATAPRATAQRSPSSKTLAQRLLLAVALEGVRCLDDGTVESAAEADVGSVVGIGFPRWTGGVLSYVETVGLAASSPMRSAWPAGMAHVSHRRPACANARARPQVSRYARQVEPTEARQNALMTDVVPHPDAPPCSPRWCWPKSSAPSRRR